MTKHVVVIGAGPAGLTCAYELTKAGVKVTLIEAHGYVGGMASSFDLWGHRVDGGPHRFISKNKRVNDLFNEIVGSRFCVINRLTRIYYEGMYFNYPLRAWNALRGLGFMEGILCVGSYLLQLFNQTGDESTFENWVTKRFGRRLYSLFFKSYSEKLWGIPCSELDSDFAAQRIRSFSLGAALLQFVKLKSKPHRTLVDEFMYPENGTGQLYLDMEEKYLQAGGMIQINRKISALQPSSSGRFHLTVDGGEVLTADHVVSTMPLTHLINALPDVPLPVRTAADKLTFRNTILVYLRMPQANLFKDNWIYIHSPNLKCGRVTNFCNWDKGMCRGLNDTILCMEYWANDDDSLWKMPDEALIELATQELLTTNLSAGIKPAEGSVKRIPRCYPVYKVGYQKHLKVLSDYLKGIQSLSVIGRYGAFKYNNQDHSMMMGILAAENIAGGKNHDLWSLNSDRDYQEESA